MKNIKFLFQLVFILMISQYSKAQLNDCYKKVDRIIWVVEDVDNVKKGWEKLGFESFVDHGTQTVISESKQNKQSSYKIKYTSASLGELKATWVQPIDGRSIYSEHLKKHGPGAMAILHRVNSKEEMKNEVVKMKEKSVEIKQKGSFEVEKGNIDYVFFDTFKDGKYILGLSYKEDQLENTSVINKNDMQFSQVAFAIRNVDPVIKYWSDKGFPEFNMVYPDGWDKEYYGKPANFQMELAFQHPGSGVAYEWCIPKTPPTVYADHIEKFGESIQHFGFNIPDMDLMLAEIKKQGLTVSQSGGWGEKGKPGSGRYAYVNMEDWGGESIELLWSYKE